MADRKTPRKTAAEVRAEERCIGYGMAFEQLRRAWHDRVIKIGVRASEYDSVAIALWDVLRPMDCEASRLDTEYKRIMMPRVYGVSPDEFTWTCHCGNPSAHPKVIARSPNKAPKQ